jgi:hypothetical protein
MAALPESWKLKPKKRSDGKLDLIGKDVTGKDYVARTTEGPGVTERDLQILSVGNRETSSAAELVNFYKKEREDYNKRKADEMTDSYMDGAERVVRAGLHLSESRVGYSRSYAEAWERVYGNQSN